ncbi:MAG TPA: bifunctional precorrin-2 dehydrogenase/sirohydrochlorin ferrochelatase [Malonomonas sp.]
MSAKIARFDYPVFLNLKQRQVVIVGAGPVGRRKLAGLLQTGALIKLIDPCLVDRPCLESGVETLARKFESGDLAGAALVFACTNRSEVNSLVAEEALRRKIFCCCSEQPTQGDFFLPALLRRGPLSVAVSTGGGSPALASLLRDQLAQQVPDSWGLGVEIIAAVRRKWLTEKLPSQYTQQVLRNFWEDQLLPTLARGDAEAVDRLLRETFGENFTLAQLQIHLPEGLP